MKNKILDHAAQIEVILERFYPKEEGLQKQVIEAMNYTLKAGGKRIRPMLIEESYRFFGGKGEEYYPFMAALEMIHTYSLVHDDLPAMDNDDYRRGRKTAHVVYGEDMAILAGDGLLNYAYEVAAESITADSSMEKKVEALKVLAKKPGIYGMLGGQAVDVQLTGEKVSKEELLFIYKCKTCALIEAALMIGAILAGASKDEVRAMEEIGEKVGYAFQIQDDILDIIGDSKLLGKPVGSDAECGKNTYAAIYGIEAAKEKVEELSREAIDSLEKMPYENEFLKELIRYLIERQA